jgi:hypothetical protein
MSQLQMIYPENSDTILMHWIIVSVNRSNHHEEDDIPGSLHDENHFTASQTVLDLVTGMSGRLPVPFVIGW